LTYLHAASGCNCSGSTAGIEGKGGSTKLTLGIYELDAENGQRTDICSLAVGSSLGGGVLEAIPLQVTEGDADSVQQTMKFGDAPVPAPTQMK
jgi:hypothetical protein